MRHDFVPFKPGSTLFLKLVIVLLGLVVLALCIFALPNGIRTTNWNGYRPILLGMYIPAIPFFLALYHGFKLLISIDTNKVFSISSIASLRIIKYCGIIISVLYGLGMPYIFYVAQQDDAPGVVLIGLIFTLAPLVIAIFAAVLQKLLSNAIEMKSENDLIV